MTSISLGYFAAAFLESSAGSEANEDERVIFEKNLTTSNEVVCPHAPQLLAQLLARVTAPVTGFFREYDQKIALEIPLVCSQLALGTWEQPCETAAGRH